MPNYYNTQLPYQYNTTPVSYGPSYAQPQMQQSQQTSAVIWVDGESAARSYQMPVGYPVNQPFPLWDSNDTVIYLKSTDQYGRPMPLRKLRYTFEDDQRQSNLPSGYNPVNGNVSGHAEIDTNQFVTKSDLDDFKNELRKMLTQTSGPNQNNNNSRGGNNNGKSSV